MSHLTLRGEAGGRGERYTAVPDAMYKTCKVEILHFISVHMYVSTQHGASLEIIHDQNYGKAPGSMFSYNLLNMNPFT